MSTFLQFFLFHFPLHGRTSYLPGKPERTYVRRWVIKCTILSIPIFFTQLQYKSFFPVGKINNNIFHSPSQYSWSTQCIQCCECTWCAYSKSFLFGYFWMEMHKCQYYMEKNENSLVSFFFKNIFIVAVWFLIVSCYVYLSTGLSSAQLDSVPPCLQLLCIIEAPGTRQ